MDTGKVMLLGGVNETKRALAIPSEDNCVMQPNYGTTFLRRPFCEYHSRIKFGDKPSSRDAYFPVSCSLKFPQNVGAQQTGLA